MTAGEQPPVDVGDGGGAVLASPGQLAEEAAERFGDLDVVLACTPPDALVTTTASPGRICFGESTAEVQAIMRSAVTDGRSACHAER
jgi:hypothetical protein